MKHDDAFYRAEAEAIGREMADHVPRQRRTPTRPALAVLPSLVTPGATLDDVHAVFRRWLGAEYDLDAIDAVLSTAAAERLDGDPLWLLLVSGSGAAKTETVQPLAGAGALVTSTITSEGALLSGTPAREKSKDATGGLLRRLGPRGVLVIKDFTSIISMNRDMRGSLLAAVREIHDGKWERNLGTDGGRTLTWEGRIAIVGAVTTAWDRAHDVIASMGDRFVLLRMDSAIGRDSARQHAMQNTGAEETMRREMSEVVGGILGTVDPSQAITLSAEEMEQIGRAADIVTLCRTGVDYDYRGDVIDAHAPEMPTRFAKQLCQVVRGAVAIGMPRGETPGAPGASEGGGMRVKHEPSRLDPGVVAIVLDGWSAPWPAGADSSACFELFEGHATAVVRVWRAHEATLRAEAPRLGIRPAWPMPNGRRGYFGEALAAEQEAGR